MTLEIKHLQTSEAKIDLSHQKDYFAEWQMAELKVSKAEKENRRLKRALWLARANYCHNFRIDWYINRHPGTKRTRSIIENTLIIAELKCRAKEEKYK